MKHIALITGVTGQDGSYLSEFLLEKDMRCTELSVVPQLTFVSALLILRVKRVSTYIMVTLVIQCHW